MDSVSDYVVVGSGPSGIQAAQTLLEHDVNVTLLDVGISNENDYSPPDIDFISIRKTDINQSYFFLGKEYEGIPLDIVKVGAQLTPARKHIIRDVEKWIPLESSNFTPMESLALGGLGAGWGLGCYTYSENELRKLGLDPKTMHEAYQVIANRIGITDVNPELKPYVLNGLENLLPKLNLDNSLQIVFNKYLRRKIYFDKNRIFFGYQSLSLLSKDLDDRECTHYYDMDFYTDKGNSAYRPIITLNKIRQNNHFRYLRNTLVVKIIQSEGRLVIETIDTQNNEKRWFSARKIILACGALGTARIVMRSFEGRIERLPILCNPYSYMPCLNLSMLGKPLNQYKTSLAQAMMIYDTKGDQTDIVTLALYTYRSLLLFRLMNEVPLGIKASSYFLKHLQSAFIIAGTHHPDNPGVNKYIKLVPDPTSPSGDKLFVNYSLDEAEKKTISQSQRKIRNALMKLQVIPIKLLNPGNGSSIHYAGTLPFNEQTIPGTQKNNGELNAFPNVYIADGSGFRYLPAKGITLTLMANAHRVAQNAVLNG